MCVFDGVVCGDAGCKAKALLRGPPESGEGEMFAGHRSTDVNVDAREGGELFVLEEFAHLVAGRMIQNDAVGAFTGTVIGDEDDGMVENPFPQGGIGDEELALESDW